MGGFEPNAHITYWRPSIFVPIRTIRLRREKQQKSGKNEYETSQPSVDGMAWLGMAWQSASGSSELRPKMFYLFYLFTFCITADIAKKGLFGISGSPENTYQCLILFVSLSTLTLG